MNSVVFKQGTIIALIRNTLMRRGRKMWAHKALEKTLVLLKSMRIDAKYVNQRPSTLIIIAVEILRPMFELQSKKVAAQKLKIPAYLSDRRSYTYAVAWLLEAASVRKDTNDFSEALAKEIVEVIKRQGGAYKKKVDAYKEVEVNRVYLKYLR